MTSFLLYNLAQLGFDIPIMEYSMDVIMDTICLAGELASGKQNEDVIDLSQAVSMEG